MFTALIIVAASIAPAAPATQPVATQPAASTQPAVGLAKYHNLLKIEFMKGEHGEIMLTPPEVLDLIDIIREDAAAEKEEVDAEITELTGEVRGAVTAEKQSKDMSRQSKAAARGHALRADRSETRISGRGVRVNRYRDGIEQARADRANAEANQHKRNAEQAKDAARGINADVRQLKARSVALGLVASSSSRAIPNRSFWGALSPDEQKLMARVGITFTEFKTLLTNTGHTEPTFLAAAKQIEAGATTEQAVIRFRDHFAKKLPPVPAAGAAANAAVAPGKPKPAPIRR